jgi:hypothetical protein
MDHVENTVPLLLCICCRGIVAFTSVDGVVTYKRLLYSCLFRGRCLTTDIHTRILYTWFIVLTDIGIIFSTHLLYIICRIFNKCVCSISTGSWMNYAQWRNSYTLFFIHLIIILILVLRLYADLSGRDRTVYLPAKISRCTLSMDLCESRGCETVVLTEQVVWLWVECG